MFSLSMPRITYFLRNGILYCRVSFKRTTSEFSTNERIDPVFWNQEKQQYFSRSNQQNKFIETLLETISYKLKSIALLSTRSSAKDLIRAMKPQEVAPNQQIKLTDCVARYIKSESKTKSPVTIQCHYAKLNNLVKFEKALKTTFYINPLSKDENFDLAIAEKFKIWYSKEKKTSNVTSPSRNIELYRRALLYSVRIGEIKAFDLTHYSPQRDTPTEPVVLNDMEFLKIVNARFTSKMMDQVKDLYLFQCSTGLAYCDLWNWQLRETKTGLFITGTRMKSKQMYFVPLDELAKAIIAKYQGKIPGYENQVYNRVLKQIAAELGIKKHLTTHTGRKTFATFMDQQGWSIESIARMLGHSSIKTTETYYISRTSNRVEQEFIQRSNINKNGYPAG